jgi:hypothetical protein
MNFLIRKQISLSPGVLNIEDLFSGATKAINSWMWFWNLKNHAQKVRVIFFLDIAI